MRRSGRGGRAGVKYVLFQLNSTKTLKSSPSPSGLSSLRPKVTNIVQDIGAKRGGKRKEEDTSSFSLHWLIQLLPAPVDFLPL